MVKRETAPQPGVSAQAKVQRAQVGPQSKVRAAGQRDALVLQKLWREVQFETEQAISFALPRLFPLRAQSFLCDTDAQPRPKIPVADSSHQ